MVRYKEQAFNSLLPIDGRTDGAVELGHRIIPSDVYQLLIGRLGRVITSYIASI